MADPLWFTNARLTIHLSRRENADGISMIEHHMAEGFAVPLHVHKNEDEHFYVINGKVLMQVDDEVLVLEPGQALTVSGGMLHSFRIVSREARFLTITTGGFEDMVRSLARPAANEGLPPQNEPTDAQIAALVAACAAHGIDFKGPPVAPTTNTSSSSIWDRGALPD
jgi:quercetin dioxygenase-like cupin family protein